MEPIVAKNKEHLKELIKSHIENYGETCDLNHIDVSEVTNMNYVFAYSRFNGDKQMGCI